MLSSRTFLLRSVYKSLPVILDSRIVGRRLLNMKGLLTLAFLLVLSAGMARAQDAGYQPPHIAYKPKGVAPKEARSTGLTGRVSLEVTIDEKGSVIAAGTATGPGWVCPQIERPDVAALRHAAKALAMRAKFRPA